MSLRRRALANLWQRIRAQRREARNRLRAGAPRTAVELYLARCATVSQIARVHARKAWDESLSKALVDYYVPMVRRLLTRTSRFYSYLASRKR